MNKDFFDSKEYSLTNGVQIVVVKRKTGLFSVNVAVKIGSIYENDRQRGISHFVEHMLFKGTNNRNNEKLNDELENMGGEYNAYTDYNCTVVNVSGLSDEFEKSLELISDMIINSNFPKDEMEREREVILSEIRTSQDDVEDYSFKIAHQLAYKDSPLKYDAIGTEKSVSKFTRQDIFDFYKKNYVPNNCCICVVSPLEYDEVKKLLEKYFNKWIPAEVSHPDIIIEDNINVKKTTYKENIEQGSILYIYTFHDLDKKHELALKILNHRFGESGNSILFRELREKRGLAYDVYSELDTTSFVKSLYIYTSVSKKNVTKTVACIDRCIEDIRNEKCLFQKDDIGLMKKVLKTSVVAIIEDTTSLCSYIIQQMVEGNDIYEFTSDIDNLQNIKKEDIYEGARAVFTRPTVHILMPKESDVFE